MTMNERKMQSLEKELEKLYKRKARQEKSLEKKTAVCEKLNCVWTKAEWFEKRDANEYTDEQYSAWFEKFSVEFEMEDTTHRIGTIERNLNKLSNTVKEENEKNEEFQKQYQQASKIEREWLRQKAEQEYEEWLRKFKAECLEDGITIEEATSSFVYGTTPNGKHFAIYINNGFTERSFHCYTLRIDGNTIFTSGEFWKAYNTVKNR